MPWQTWVNCAVGLVVYLGVGAMAARAADVTGWKRVAVLLFWLPYIVWALLVVVFVGYGGQ